MFRPCAVFLGVALVSSSLFAQSLEIDHKPVGCLIAGEYPRMVACFAPRSRVARGRVYFRAAGTLHWYFVDMHTDAPCFSGVLPKPRGTIESVDYYLQVVSSEFAETRTAEYAPVVVESREDCDKDAFAAPTLKKASVLVGSAAAGAPAVPAGFASAGLAGAGLSTGVVAGVVGGGAAVAGGVLASGGDGGSAGSTPTTRPPVTTVPPAPTPTTAPPPPLATPSPAAPARANGPPAAVFRVDPEPPRGNSPLTVTFNMCASHDPDEDDLRFTFDFGDGATDSGFCRVSHTYSVTTPGTFEFTPRVCVTDGLPGHEVCRTYRVVVEGVRSGPAPPPAPTPTPTPSPGNRKLGLTLYMGKCTGPLSLVLYSNPDMPLNNPQPFSIPSTGDYCWRAFAPAGPVSYMFRNNVFNISGSITFNGGAPPDQLHEWNASAFGAGEVTLESLF